MKEVTAAIISQIIKNLNKVDQELVMQMGGLLYCLMILK